MKKHGTCGINKPYTRGEYSNWKWVHANIGRHFAQNISNFATKKMNKT
jgi:hypothetical protein